MTTSDPLGGRVDPGLADRLAGLSEAIAQIAPRHDRETTFPSESFDLLADRGLLAAAVPTEHGGLGLGVCAGRQAELYEITRHVARGDLSVGRCFEGHVNAVELINFFTKGQVRDELLRGVVESDWRFAVWGSEAAKPGGTFIDSLLASTTATHVDDHLHIKGRKLFATSAGAATHTLVLAELPDGEDLEREERYGFISADLRGPGFEIDTTWWHPMGMRGTVSHAVDFDGLTADLDHVICTFGQYLEELWQARFLPHFVASFLGTAEATHQFASAYAVKRGKGDDALVQHHLGEMASRLLAIRSSLEYACRAWAALPADEAAATANACRAVGEREALQVVQLASQVCGATALLEDYPLERHLRDLLTYVRHESIDRILTAIGRAELGMATDLNFAVTEQRPSEGGARR